VEPDAHREESDEPEQLQDTMHLDEGEPIRAEQVHAPDPRKEEPETEAEADRQPDGQRAPGEHGERRWPVSLRWRYASSR